MLMLCFIGNVISLLFSSLNRPSEIIQLLTDRPGPLLDHWQLTYMFHLKPSSFSLHGLRHVVLHFCCIDFSIVGLDDYRIRPEIDQRGRIWIFSLPFCYLYSEWSIVRIKPNVLLIYFAQMYGIITLCTISSLTPL